MALIVCLADSSFFTKNDIKPYSMFDVRRSMFDVQCVWCSPFFTYTLNRINTRSEQLIINLAHIGINPAPTMTVRIVSCNLFRARPQQCGMAETDLR